MAHTHTLLWSSLSSVAFQDDLLPPLARSLSSCWSSCCRHLSAGADHDEKGENAGRTGRAVQRTLLPGLLVGAVHLAFAFLVLLVLGAILLVCLPRLVLGAVRRAGGLALLPHLALLALVYPVPLHLLLGFLSVHAGGDGGGELAGEGTDGSGGSGGLTGEGGGEGEGGGRLGGGSGGGERVGVLSVGVLGGDGDGGGGLG
eukprot:scaffold57756_cov67-Phaeocystis_antarctica.AAC.3